MCVMPAGPEKTGGGGTKIAAEQRTNSVVLSGGRLARLKYRAIIYDLDSPVGSVSKMQVADMRYAKAKNIASVLDTVC